MTLTYLLIAEVTLLMKIAFLLSFVDLWENSLRYGNYFNGQLLLGLHIFGWLQVRNGKWAGSNKRRCGRFMAGQLDRGSQALIVAVMLVCKCSWGVSLILSDLASFFTSLWHGIGNCHHSAHNIPTRATTYSTECGRATAMFQYNVRRVYRQQTHAGRFLLRYSSLLKWNEGMWLV